MATQTYSTHRHNPKLTGVAFVFVVVAVAGFALRGFHIGGRAGMAIGLFGLVAADIVLLIISREYTTKLQDRIIRLEMQLRCAPLLTPAQQALLARCSLKRIAALRFASNAELPALLEQADRDNLSADQIKRAIKDWVPDWDRT